MLCTNYSKINSRIHLEIKGFKEYRFCNFKNYFAQFCFSLPCLLTCKALIREVGPNRWWQYQNYFWQLPFSCAIKALSRRWMIEQCFIPCRSKRLEVGNVGKPNILVSLAWCERSVPTPMSIKWVLKFQACLRFHCLHFKGDFKTHLR